MELQKWHILYTARLRHVLAVQRAHSSGAESVQRGVNDLTEDSVELTPAVDQTICSFHQQLPRKKKKKRQEEDGKRCVIRQEWEQKQL